MKKRNKILCGFLVLSLIIGTAVPSRATIKDEKDKLNNLQNEQEDVQQQINGLENQRLTQKHLLIQWILRFQLFQNKCMTTRMNLIKLKRK